MDKYKELLLKSFDTQLDEEERLLLNEALKKDAELRQEKIEMEEMRKLFADFSPVFSDEFSNNVIDSIEKETIEEDNLFYLFKRFALGGVAAIALLLLSVYFTDGRISIDTLLGLSDLDSNSLLFALSNF